MYIYIIAICLLLFGIGVYFKLKYGFWLYQPVVHLYDLHYMMFPPGIINKNLPKQNKYTNFKDIETTMLNDMTELKINDLIHFIKQHYLREGKNTFLPSKENVMPYFKSHDTHSFFTRYTTPQFLNDTKNNSIVEIQKTIGIITSRPLHVIINNKNTQTKFDVYYVDYLCVDTTKRKMGIASQLIQTHEYNQRHINPNIKVSLFKREDELTGIMPLCIYKTYGFSVDKWTKPLALNATYSIIEIGTQNIHLLHDYIKESTGLFNIIIMSNISNIVELIKTDNLYIRVILFQDKCKCAYFFKKTNTFIDTNMEVLTSVASIQSPDLPDDIFIQGFKIAFWDIANKYKFGFSAIENISHNHKIITNISIKTHPLVVSPTAYFFYNYGINSVDSKKVIILN